MSARPSRHINASHRSVACWNPKSVERSQDPVATTTSSVTIKPSSAEAWALYATNGARVTRDEPGPVDVACDHPAAVSSACCRGSALPFLGGLILLVLWRVGTGGGGGRWLFGPRTRPRPGTYLPQRNPT
jgi:hypothetical protein